MDESAEFIHDSAVRAPSPTPRVDRILTGHERRERDHCWRPEGTTDWLLVHTISGRAVICLPDRERRVGPGESVLYRPGAPQDFASDGSAGSWELVWAHCEPPPHWLELLRWPELSPGVLCLAASEPALRARVETLLLEANRVFGSGLPRADRLAFNALEGALLWWDLQNPARRSLDPRVVAAIDYLSHRVGEPVSLDEFAEAAHLSVSRFAHLFTRETGLAPRRFVEQQRVERAKQLLELTSLPVNAVSRHVGFRSQFYFATRFKKLTGLTPSAYRAAAWSAASVPAQPDS